MRKSWSDAEVVRETLHETWGAVVLRPDSRLVVRDGWRQIVTPSLRTGGLNEVAFARIAAGDADRVIDETIAEYARLGLRFRWAVTPDSEPADLAERLARRGLMREECRVMYREIDAAPPAAPGVVLVDDSSVEEFSRVMAAGWGMEPAPIAEYNRTLLRAPRQKLFLARDGARGVATAAAVLLERSTYLIGAVVLPEARGRGIYRALVDARIRLAHERGLTLATSLARESSSAPILEKLGFRTAARLPVFRTPEPSSS